MSEYAFAIVRVPCHWRTCLTDLPSYRHSNFWEMDWKRESEFRRLLSAQIKHLTKEGLETLAHIATTDMAEVCFIPIHHLLCVVCDCVCVV